MKTCSARERKDFTKYDNIIIGAGLAGLFTAINLQQKFPKETILVLDKEMFPAASTKNAGFACMGSITELEDDLLTSSTEEVLSLFEKRYMGLQIMRSVLGDTNIGYHEHGSYELVTQRDISVLDNIEQWNKLLFHIGNRDAFSLDDLSKTTFLGFSNLIKNELEGEIDTGRMYKFLKRKVSNLGIDIKTGFKVLGFERTSQCYQVSLDNGFMFKTERLILCTNAFTEELMPEIKIIPARGQVLITKPIPNLPFKGVYHFDRGYYYFREIDGRILFGGGRQLNESGEETTAFGNTALIIDDLKHRLQNQIVPNGHFEIDSIWSGIMGKASNKEPVLKQFDERLFLLAGFGGMGVALAPFMSQELVQLIN